MNSGARLIFGASSKFVVELCSLENVSVEHVDECIVVLRWQGACDKSLWLACGLENLFESTWISVENCGRRQLVSSFFDFISLDYQAEIDEIRNISCYRHLLDLCVLFRGSSAKSILDVGCGVGLIRKVVDDSVQVVGYDLSRGVSRIAEQNGLEIVSEANFANGVGNFDAVVSAYAMHYAVEPGFTIDAVARHMSPVGIWAMNFHKGLGFDAFVQRLDTSPLSVLVSSCSRDYGKLLVVGHR